MQGKTVACPLFTLYLLYLLFTLFTLLGGGSWMAGGETGLA